MGFVNFILNYLKGKQMELSIIIPVYNTEIKKIERCINSTLKVNLSDYEIVFIDDGSKEELSKKYNTLVTKYKNVKYFKKPNGGVSSARNYGIEKATKKYVMFVDSDDFLESEKIADLQIEDDLVLYNYKIIENGQTTELKFSGENNLASLIEDILNDPRLAGPMAKLFKKSFIIENNILFNKKMYIGEDFDFLYQVIENKPTINIINELIYSYDYNIESSILRAKKYDNKILENEINNYNKKIKLIEDYNLNQNYVNIVDNIFITALANYAISKIRSKNLTNSDKETMHELIKKINIKSCNKKAKIKYFLMKNDLWFAMDAIYKLFIR